VRRIKAPTAINPFFWVGEIAGSFLNYVRVDCGTYNFWVGLRAFGAGGNELGAKYRHYRSGVDRVRPAT